MKSIKAFGRFWYDFVVGDDWSIAVIVVLLVVLTALLTHRGWNVWPLTPAGVAVVLTASTWRVVRQSRRDES
jgi:hypothetical protein